MSLTIRCGLVSIVAGIALAGTPALLAGPSAVVSTHLRTARSYPGSLLVYTAREEFNDGNILYYPHTSYEIRTADGKHLRGVRNRLGHNDEEPEMVELPAGKYLVVADSEREGRVILSIMIRAGGVTLVNLQRDPPARLPLALR